MFFVLLTCIFLFPLLITPYNLPDVVFVCDRDTTTLPSVGSKINGKSKISSDKNKQLSQNVSGKKGGMIFNDIFSRSKYPEIIS